ncbi:MAG: hypothetical protein HPY64_00090 [Anaerolineae bacterium]|nr:hypothetical protein [Anaerolineae bacterium]
MNSVDLEQQEAADILFFEAEGRGGFLDSLESRRIFDELHWQRLWQAVASLAHYTNGVLDIWAEYDLSRIIDAIQKHSLALVGRQYSSLDDFERHVLDAALFLQNIFSSI